MGSLDNAKLDHRLEIRAALSRFGVDLLSSGRRTTVYLQLLVHRVGTVDTVDLEERGSVLTNDR